MQHNSSNAGAKYTRGRRPVELVYHTQAATLKEARALEAMYKRMTRSQKLILIATM
jgi:putative endonuclease